MRFVCIFLIVSFSAFLEAAPRKNVEKDIEEIPDLIEGDIIPNPLNKNGVIDESYRWPNATVVYELDAAFSIEERVQIFNGWAEIRNTTCITFRERVDETNYVYVRRGAQGSGCSSSVGMVGGWQNMNLEAPSCTDRHGTIIHEMLHAIGFYHEQARPDRDDFVEIVQEKIEPGKEHNFIKRTEAEVSTFGAPYDYGSVLHYSGRAFSIDGNDTIVPKIPGVTIGQRLKISQIDAGKVRLMYNCPE